MKNEPIKLIDASAAAGANTTKSFTIDNPDASGIDVILNLIAENLGGGAGSITVNVEGVDPYGAVYPILTSAAIVAAAKVVLRVARGLTAAANVTANGQVPKQLKITATHNNANPMRYTLGAHLIR